MRKDDLGPLPRLADSPPAGDEREAALVRALRTPPRFSPAASQRLADEVLAPARPAPRAFFRLSTVAAGVAVLLGGGAVMARYQPAPLRTLLALVTPHRTVRHSVAPVRPPAPAQPPAAPEAAPAPAPRAEPEPPSPAVVHERPVRHHHRTLALRGKPVPAAPPAEVAPSPLAAETRLLGQALTELRQRRDPTAALAALDEYEAQFPAGALAFDALAARVDALIALGRKQAALARLEAVPGDALSRSPSLRAQRAELRAAMGQLAAAEADFDRVLDSVTAGTRSGHGAGASAGADLAERALYGRGACRARRGDAAGARQDLDLYLQLYPAGRFAPEARRALGR